jgi:hypothetical protein
MQVLTRREYHIQIRGDAVPCTCPQSITCSECSKLLHSARFRLPLAPVLSSFRESARSLPLFMRISIPSRFFQCATTLLADTTRQPLASLFLSLLCFCRLHTPVLYGIIPPLPLIMNFECLSSLTSLIDRAVKRLIVNIVLWRRAFHCFRSSLSATV